MNLLFIADPNSIHEYKKISYFSKKPGYKCYIVPYNEHAETFWKSKFWMDMYKEAGVEVLSAIPYFSLTNFKKTLNARNYIKSVIIEKKIDAFIIIYVEPSALLALFKDYFKVPILLFTFGTDVLKTIPSFFGKKQPFKKLIAHLYRKAFNQADAIAGTSDAQLKIVSKLSGRQDELYLIRTGVNMQQIDADTSAYMPKELIGRKYVFFPRNMLPLYDHEWALNAIALLPESLKKEYTFVFVNSDSSNIAYVNKIRGMMSKMENVSFCFLTTQTQPSIFELNKNAALAVMTPTSDGAPVSAMEAMACNVPLILPPLAYDKDIFSEGVYHLKSREAEELALVIEKILNEEIVLDTEKANFNIRQNADYHGEMAKLEEVVKSIV